LALCAVQLSGAAACAGPIKLSLQARTIFGRTTSGRNTLVQIYRTANGMGIDWLDPETMGRPLTTAEMLNTNQNLYFNFFNTLNVQFGNFNGWNITGDQRQFSQNDILVHTYQAIGTAASVGANIDIEYKPAGTDPTVNMHWIQVVSDNHNITTNPGHGNLENVVDLAADNVGAGRTPYYDTGTPVVANSRNFLDGSRRTDVEQNHNWVAALFLVSGPNAPGTAANPAQIKIYNDSGIFWGWKNTFFPTQNPVAFANDVMQQIEPQIPVDQRVEFNNEFNSELTSLVPEPASAVLFVFGGACLLVHVLRNATRRPSTAALPGYERGERGT
jgi:hypothetical protein